MLDVFITVDVEIWCDGWHDLDSRFAHAFDRHVYGTTPSGQYGLPYHLEVFGDHGLGAVFFVESLFSLRFGPEPLAEIVDLIGRAGQEMQLHLHTEWVSEASLPGFANAAPRRARLRDFSRDEQAELIAISRRLLEQAGVERVSAFRAGNFAFNRDTLAALAANHLFLDASYNATMFGPESGVMPGVTLVEPVECGAVVEYPMTVFTDGAGRLRHAQVTACSYREMEALLWSALESRRQAFVILLHNFELLNRVRTAVDPVVVERFRRLCAFLDRNRDSFRVRGFNGLEPRPVEHQPPPLSSSLWKTAGRMFEQISRRQYE